MPLLKCIQKHPQIHKDKIRVHYSNLSDSAATIDITCWIDTNDQDLFLETRHSLLLQLIEVVESFGAAAVFKLAAPGSRGPIYGARRRLSARWWRGLWLSGLCLLMLAALPAAALQNTHDVEFTDGPEPTRRAVPSSASWMQRTKAALSMPVAICTCDPRTCRRPRPWRASWRRCSTRRSASIVSG